MSKPRGARKRRRSKVVDHALVIPRKLRRLPWETKTTIVLLLRFAVAVALAVELSLNLPGR